MWILAPSRATIRVQVYNLPLSHLSFSKTKNITGHPSSITAKMVVLANIIIPLYIYPLQNENKWKPLTDAAIAHPNITFTAVINPNSGPAPEDDGCPNMEYINAINELTTTPNNNIRTMGYIHTANRFDCGMTGTYICPCSRPIEELEQEISIYKSWGTKDCTKEGTVTNPDIHMDSLFIDESPNLDKGANLTYMSSLTDFAKDPNTGFVDNSAGGKVLFNAGGATELAYFDVADVIVILENNQTEYERIPDIGVLNGGGKYSSKSSVIMYEHEATQSVVRRDVETILGKDRDGFESLYLTDAEGDGLQYTKFPSASFWETFLGEVERVAEANRAFV